MHVPSKARRSVIFIGEMTGGKFMPRATAFLAASGDERGRSVHFPYLITAEHVIAGMAYKQKEIFVRYNLKDGTARVESIHAAKWWYHPSCPERTDVAVAPIAFDWDIVDHECVPLFSYDPLSDWPILKRPGSGYGLGDETFAIGLFRSHYGTQRNMPIVRIGNISALPEEPIRTEHGSGFIDGYLVEMRSIAGLSGSPVFVDRPEVPPRGFIADTRYKPDPENVNWFRYHFLGLIHGHFDVPSPLEDMASEDDRTATGINTGMGIVIPAIMVLETLYQEELIEERKRLFAEALRSEAAIDDPN